MLKGKEEELKDWSSISTCLHAQRTYSWATTVVFPEADTHRPQTASPHPEPW